MDTLKLAIFIYTLYSVTAAYGKEWWQTEGKEQPWPAFPGTPSRNMLELF